MKRHSTKSTRSTKQSRYVPKSNPYELLDEFGQKIVDLRLEGWKYSRLQGVAKKQEQTIRTWFMAGGQYYEAYVWRRNQLIDEVRKDCDDAEFQLKQGVPDAVVVLKTEVTKKNWKAAVALLKMAGFNVQKVITTEESDATKYLREIIQQRRDTKRRLREAVQTEQPTSEILTEPTEDL